MKAALAKESTKLADIFKGWDADSSGAIDRDEFRQMLNDMGLTYASFLCVYSSPGSLPLTLWVLAAGSPIRSLSS